MPIQVGDKIYGDKNKVKNVALELCRVASRDFRVHKSTKDFIKIRCMSINCPFQLNAVHENESGSQVWRVTSVTDNHICEKADSTRQRSYSVATKLSNSGPLINFVPTGRYTKDGILG